ncbi:MAG: N-6 DNA methylase [Solirubrobacteraceae bacterium]
MTEPSIRSLLAPSDIAKLAGVGRPVVSNWRKRHDDFPEPAAGTPGRPLFDRRDIVHWLDEHGYEIQSESNGARLWSVLSAARGSVEVHVAAELLLLVMSIKHLRPEALDLVKDRAPSDPGGWLLGQIEQLPELRHAADTADSDAALLRREPRLWSLVQFVASLSEKELPLAADYVLEQAGKSYGRGAGEHGFIGSRTATALASLVPADARVVYDPACGIGSVLTQAAESATSARLIGVDVNMGAIAIAEQRALLRDLRIELWRSDTLTDDPTPDLRADMIVAEPPFGLRWDPNKVMADPRFSFGLASKNSSDLAWVEHAVHHLAEGGRAHVLTSLGPLFRSGVDRAIRAKLLSSGCIQSIVTLPPKMLPHTSISTALWTLTRSSTADSVLLIDATEIEEVEHRIAAWLTTATDGVTPSIDAPHIRVAVTDLLAAQSALEPARWIGLSPADPAEMSARVRESLREATNALDCLRYATLSIGPLTDLSAPRVVTVRDLVESSAIKFRPGRPDRSRDLDEKAERSVIRASDVRDRVLPPSAGDLPGLEDELTKPGDVLVTTMNEVRALVDETGGHLPSTGVERLRITDPSLLTPAYLAAVLVGAWNARFQAGSTIQRAPIRDLEIPLLPRAEQDRVVEVQSSIESLARHSTDLKRQTSLLWRASLDSLRYGIPITDTPARTKADR